VFLETLTTNLKRKDSCSEAGGASPSGVAQRIAATVPEAGSQRNSSTGLSSLLAVFARGSSKHDQLESGPLVLSRHVT
jgi:hypothetical protein